jgi:hypothetical protein
MGADEVQADLGRFADLSRRTAALADSIQHVVDTVQALVISSESQTPWGRDDLGNRFLNGDANNGFDASAKNMAAGGAQLVATLRQYANGLAQSGTLMGNGEAEAVAAFNQSGPRTPDSHTPWMPYTRIAE